MITKLAETLRHYNDAARYEGVPEGWSVLWEYEALWDFGACRVRVVVHQFFDGVERNRRMTARADAWASGWQLINEIRSPVNPTSERDFLAEAGRLEQDLFKYVTMVLDGL
jgi:hypothetical protein